MKFYVCSLLATAAMALPAHGATPAVEENQEDQATMVVTMVEQNLFNPLAMPASCTAVALDATQTASLKDAYFAFQKEKNTLGAVAKNAWMDVRHTFMSATSMKTDGQSALAAAKTAAGNLGDAAGMFSTTVFFDILKPTQRSNAWMCMRDIGKMKRLHKLREICAKLPPAPAPTQ